MAEEGPFHSGPEFAEICKRIKDEITLETLVDQDFLSTSAVHQELEKCVQRVRDDALSRTLREKDRLLALEYRIGDLERSLRNQKELKKRVYELEELVRQLSLKKLPPCDEEENSAMRTSVNALLDALCNIPRPYFEPCGKPVTCEKSTCTSENYEDWPKLGKKKNKNERRPRTGMTVLSNAGLRRMRE